MIPPEQPPVEPSAIVRSVEVVPSAPIPQALIGMISPAQRVGLPFLPRQVETGSTKPKAPTFECFVREADRYNIDPFVLLAVLKTENGRPGDVLQNKNGSQDLGVMSINTVWLQDFARKLDLNEETVRQILTSDGCANVAAGAWILGQRIAEAQGNVWEGVARYHSRTPSKQITYLNRVKARLQDTLARLRKIQP